MLAVLGGVIYLIVYFVANPHKQFLSGGGYGGGGYGSRGYGSRGYGGYGGRGCFDYATTVWTKNETSSDEYARQVKVLNLVEGNLVGTMDINSRPYDPKKMVWSRATDVTIQSGHYKGHYFEFSTGHHLTVTSAHLMIIWKNGKSYFVRADEVQVGDAMQVQEAIAHVTKIENIMIMKKVSIETEDGTVQANGVLASGLCDHNPEVHGRVVKSGNLVKNYKILHFGEKYNTMCMDRVTWKNSYMINNGYF